MLEISAIIITLNEERNLPRALESLSIADEIVVVDSGSTDRTIEIARSHGARVIEHSWEGYAQQKNFAATQAKHSWILSLDADEELSPELIAEIQRIKRDGVGEAAGFTMPRMANYLGRWIRHSGWYPDWKVRLYDKGRAKWAGDFVHERVEVNGPVNKLSGDIRHYTCNTFSDHLKTLDRYTTLSAKESFATGRRSHLVGMILGPPWKFAETYLFRQGLRDAFPGFCIAVMAGFYVFLKFAKLRQMVQEDRGTRRS